MKIGVPKEVKDQEYRVGMTPGGCRSLVLAGHQVFVQAGAGDGSGFSDDEFRAKGVTILESADDVWNEAEMVIKVKEPVKSEYHRMKPGHLLFTYLHLAPLPGLTDELLAREVTGVAYETITGRTPGSLPLLAPMSEVAGRMSVLVGATHLQRAHGGRGVLISGVPGVPPGDVVILGGGIVGINAIKMAWGVGSRVTVLETNPERMRYIDEVFHGGVTTLASNPHSIEASIENADLVIGAVLIPGHSAPRLVTREMLADMRKGSVLVDVAVDQGGCFETTRPTTHSDPTYEVDGIIHYCVANMPGAVPRTSTMALTNATLNLALALANKGFERAVEEDPYLRAGVNVYKGHITCQPVAHSQNKPYTDLATLLPS